MSKLISVITPAETNEKYISIALQSLKEQTYTHFEVLVLHSDIGFLKKHLASEAASDDRIKYIETSPGLNVGAVRNIGIDHADGEYIYFLDSDDYISEHTLELLIKHINDQPMIRGKVKNINFASSTAVITPGLDSIRMFAEKRYNLLQSNSALNFLIDKHMIDELNLRFSEQFKTYADLTFMIPLLEIIPAVPYADAAIYFRRKRNDPINNPSLRQAPTKQLTQDLLGIYHMIKKRDISHYAERYLDNKLLNFYRWHLILEFKDTDKINIYYPELVDAIKEVNPTNISDKDLALKSDIIAMKSNRLSTFKKWSKFRQLLKDMNRGLSSLKSFKNLVYKRLFGNESLRDNLVLFESFQGKSYSDSPKYIYQHMLKYYEGYKFAWVMNDTSVKIPGKPATVKRGSLKYYYYAARARYVVTNVRMPNNYIKRPGQTLLQTWHGTPLKRLAGDMEDVYMPGTNSARYKMNFNRETDKWDYLIAPNPYSSRIFRRAFWFNNTILNSGYPRNDILINGDDANIIKGLKKKSSLPNDKKVILYAPTWRDDEFYETGKYKFSLKLDLQRMKEELGDEYIILLRMHYVIASNIDLTGLEDFAYDVSGYNDVSELFLMSDILITDYSSVFFDYANLRRPVLFYTYDLDKYRNQLRGFYIDMETELPGPLLKTNEEVFGAIKNIDAINREYEDVYKEFYDRFCSWDDGHASERVVKTLFDQER